MFLMLLFMMVIPTTISSARSFLQPIQKTYLSRLEGEQRAASGEMITLLVTKVDDYNVVKGFHLLSCRKASNVGLVRAIGNTIGPL